MIAFIFFPLLLIQPAWSLTRVVVDPGHGGSDRGAIHGGVAEADIVLSLSHKLHSLLAKDKNFRSKLLRTDDREFGLPERVSAAREFSATLFISIHANSNPNQALSGAEFYIQNQMAPAEEAKFLASLENRGDWNTKITDPHTNLENVGNIIYDLQKTQKILESYKLGWYLQKHWPGLSRDHQQHLIRQGPFYVLSQNHITAVLVEVGYLSNPQERSKLATSAYQWQIANLLYKGIKDYASNMDKVPSPALQP